MTRLDELDRIPFERGKRHAIMTIADWWLDRIRPRQKHHAEFMAFLRERFRFLAKRCTVCRRWKPDYDFPRAKACKDGRNGFCRDCYAAQRAQRRLDNLEAARARARAKYAASSAKADYLREWRKRKAAKAA